VYYAIANASALTLGRDEGRPPRAVPVVGLAGCVLLAFALPVVSVVSGAAVLAAGLAVHGVRRAVANRRDSPTTGRPGSRL
jgi:basic amino acid/polyamine antiporter, APA family